MTGYPSDSFDDFATAELPRLLRYAVALTGSTDLAGDVVQDAMVRAHVRWSSIMDMDHPVAYVKRMVTNEYLSWRRRWHVRSIVPVDDGALHERAPVRADAVQGVVDRDALWGRTAALPRKQRAVLVLRCYEEMSDAEAVHAGIRRGVRRRRQRRRAATGIGVLAVVAVPVIGFRLVDGSADDPRPAQVAGAPVALTSEARLGEICALEATSTSGSVATDAEAASAQEFFDAGYGVDDAAELAGQWKVPCPYGAKILAGEKLAAGERLDVQPGSAGAPGTP